LKKVFPITHFRNFCGMILFLNNLIRKTRDKKFFFKKLALLVFVSFLLPACEREYDPFRYLTPSEAHPKGTRVYKEISPVVLQLPQDVIDALGGVNTKGEPLKETHIYFKSMAIVAYREDFSVRDYIDRIARAFAGLTKVEDFGREADNWSIQLQKRGTSKFVVMSCTPKQVGDYVVSGDMKILLGGCDFFMINDLIVSEPEKRYKLYETNSEPTP
jgi:hypothetical protein